MNQGLSSSLKLLFPNTNAIDRPVIDYEGIPHPNWLVGFIDGEGCFYVNTRNNKSKSGVRMAFIISQHSRDYFLISNIVSYLNYGIIEKPKGRFEVKFVIYKFDDIFIKLIPFF